MKMENLLKDWQLNAGATEEALNAAGLLLEHSLPRDYAAFLREHNGGEGFIGDNYLILWKAEELSTFNREYEVDQYAPGILLFGSNGGGEGYGFDARDAAMSVVRVPFIGMDLQYAVTMARNFSEFIMELAK